ncbi:uncharacterized protein LOC143441279 isoform X1 [Arvicanthis niloticus]
MTPPLPAAAGRQQQPCYPEPRHDPEPYPAYRKSPIGKATLAGDAVRKPQSQNGEAAASRGRDKGRDLTSDLRMRAALGRFWSRLTDFCLPSSVRIAWTMVNTETHN